MLIDLGILFLLLLLNGFFAMAEMSIVSSRRARLRGFVEDERPGAREALRLAEDAPSFLSVVQIGMTLISVMAGAFGGAIFAEPLGDYLNGFAWIAPYGPHVGLIITVAGVTYANLVVGELLPKRLGISYAETIALRVAPFMVRLARVAAPIVWTLRFSTDVLLKSLRLNNPNLVAVTEEEVKDLIAEGTETGVFKPAERKMLEGVMRLADRTVRTIMTPRIDLVWLSLDDERDERVKIIHDSGYSRFPVARGDLDEVMGIVHAKDLLNSAFEGKQSELSEIVRAPLIVPDTTPVLRLVDQFKQSSQHMAVVIDEYGSVEGIVTVTDILEAITGELPQFGQDQDDKPVQREDGSWLLDGMMPIDEVENLIGLKNMRDGEGDYHTIAGFMIDRLGRIPVAGDHFSWADARFEVMDMDGRRVDKVLIAPPEGDEDDEL